MIIIFTTGETVGLAEWIIDDTCLVQCHFVFDYILTGLKQELRLTRLVQHSKKIYP